MKTIKIPDARLCKDCGNLVTADALCPLCSKPTTAHPDCDEKEGFCYACAEGPFPAENLHVVTYNENPYLQIEEGDLILRCAQCQDEQEELNNQVWED